MAAGRPYKRAMWHRPEEYDDVHRLAGFFTTAGIQYWKMAQRPDLIRGGDRVSALALDGAEYVFYAAAGGRLLVALPEGTFDAMLYNPREGSFKRLEAAKGGGTIQFECPTGQDWVVLLKKKTTWLAAGFNVDSSIAKRNSSLLNCRGNLLRP